MRPMREVQSALLARREELVRRLEGRQVALFLDYDGTLSPIVPNPEDARLSDAMRATLVTLARHYPVAIVSGRDLPVLKGFVGLEGVSYAGSHGFEIEGPGGQGFELEEGRALMPELDAAELELASGFAGLAGVRLERKRFSVAVHWRHVEVGRGPEVERGVDAVLARHPRLRKSGGKKVFEVQPDIDWHKGRAMQWMLRALGLEGERVLPVFVGDDLTDEDAFKELEGRGLGLVVRGEVERPTAADYALADVEEVRQFLELLIARAQGAKR